MTELERLRDALDHIIRQCEASNTPTRRLLWIKTRAEMALAGDDSWREVLRQRPRSLAKELAPTEQARKDKIRAIFQSNGFNTRPQPDGSVDLNRSVYYAVEQIIEAYARGELE